MRIGAVAQAADVSIDTIRYYERRGLLPEPQRRPSGYREYGPVAVERLRFIRRAKELGFSLNDIHELLVLSHDRDAGVAGVKARAEVRLAEVERRMVELERMRAALEKLIAACPGHGDLGGCPILASLSGDEST